jgi:hypothetical protein
MQEIQERAPRNKPRAASKKQSRRDYSSFDRATFMFLRPSKHFVLWNSTSAMRRNGYQPSTVAAHLTDKYGIEIYDPRRKDEDSPYPFGALAYFEGLVVREGSKAPSLVYDEPWGQA